MNYSSYGTEKKRAFEKDYETYIRDIYRLCFSFMKNHMDAEDVVQETFLKYYNWILNSSLKHIKKLG